MGVVDGRTWLERVSPAMCWELLASTPVGRIGVLNDSAPEIYPVNHVVDDQSIVFRTDPGSKLRGLGRSPAVCYEVDGIDVDNTTGWSVLVKGARCRAQPSRRPPPGRPAATALLEPRREATLDPRRARAGHRTPHLAPRRAELHPCWWQAAQVTRAGWRQAAN